MRKVLGDVVDYTAAFELLQFQFDRYILRCTLGSAAIVEGRGNTLAALAHRPWTPQYWRRHHEAPQDYQQHRVLFHTRVTHASVHVMS